MRKNKLRQILLAVLVGTNAMVAWGQMPQNGKVYRINTVGKNGYSVSPNTTPYYLTSDVAQRGSVQRLVMKSSLDVNDPQFYFRLDANGTSTSQFALYSLKRRQYFKPSSWNDNVLPFQSAATSQYMQFAAGTATNTVKFNHIGVNSYFQAYHRAIGGDATADFERQGTLTVYHNFTFTQVNASVITVASNVGNLGETYTFDGNNGVGNQFVALLDNSSNADGVTLAQTSTPVGYTFTGFTWAGQSTPQLNPTIPLSTLQANPELVVTANYTSSFYSNQFGEKWVRIFMVRDGSEKYAWRLNDGAGAEGLKISTSPVDYADDRFLWCLVGSNGNNFVIKNKATGDQFALTTQDVDPANGTTPYLTAASSAKVWKHSIATAEGESGYKFNVTTGSADRSPNAHGGFGRGLAYWNIDGGSIWRIELADAAVTLNTAVTGADVNTLSNTQKPMARLQIAGTTANISVTSEALLTAGETKTLYLPSTGGFTLATPTAMRNYGTITSTYATSQAVSGNATYTVTGAYNDEKAHYLFTNTSGSVGHYKVPAVTVTPSGDVIAMANYSALGESSSGAYQTSAGILGGIGNSRIVPGKVRVALRVGSNNGATWGDQTFITPESETYGDVAITADHKEDKVLVMMAKVTDNRAFNTSTRQAPLQIARIIGTRDNGGNWTWTQPEEVTTQIYALNSSLIAAYFTSGRILQSKVVKNGSYFRVYASLVTKDNSNNSWKNRVVYSDDFGQNWSLLGGATAVAIDAADEATLLETPNGNLVISSRKNGGRKFSVFTYTDKATGAGSWATSTDGMANGAACNGDMLLVNVKNGSNKATLALHSLPTTSTYNNVGIYHKEMADANSTTVADWVNNWSNSSSVSSTTSGYSTMDVQKDGSIGFFFEENLAGAGYDMVYKALPVSTLNTSYSVDTDVVTEAENVINSTDFVGGYTAADIVGVQEAKTAYTGNTALLRNVEAEMNLLKATKQPIAFEAGKYYRLYANNGNVVTTNYAGATTNTTEDATKVSQLWTLSGVSVGNVTLTNPNQSSSAINANVNSVSGANHNITIGSGVAADYRLKAVTSVAVKVSSTHSTFHFPFAVTKPENVKIYKGNLPTLNSESKVVLKELTDNVVPANTPVVLYSTNGGGNKVFTINYDDNTPSPTDNVLVGMLAPTVLRNGDYILKTVGGVAGFYPITTTNKDNTMMGVANKVYIPANTFAGSPSFLPITDGEEPTTGISGVVTDSKAVKYYNLNGTLVTKPIAGVIYITSEGKKVMFK